MGSEYGRAADLTGSHEQGAARQDDTSTESLGDEKDKQTAGRDLDGSKDCSQQQIAVAFVANE